MRIHEHDFSPITLNGQNHFVICINCKTCYCTICGRALFSNKYENAATGCAAVNNLRKCIEKKVCSNDQGQPISIYTLEEWQKLARCKTMSTCKNNMFFTN